MAKIDKMCQKSAFLVVPSQNHWKWPTLSKVVQAPWSKKSYFSDFSSNIWYLYIAGKIRKKALWTASKWAQLVSSAREINPHWPHCTSWWSKISKSRLSWATWTLWPGMEATKSGWQEKIRLLLSPPSLYLTSTDHYIHFWSSSGGIAEVLSWASEANAF